MVPSKCGKNLYGPGLREGSLANRCSVRSRSPETRSSRICQAEVRSRRWCSIDSRVRVAGNHCGEIGVRRHQPRPAEGKGMVRVLTNHPQTAKASKPCRPAYDCFDQGKLLLVVYTGIDRSHYRGHDLGCHHLIVGRLSLCGVVRIA